MLGGMVGGMVGGMLGGMLIPSQREDHRTTAEVPQRVRIVLYDIDQFVA